MDTRIRKRGIKASRAKLEVAMLNAGVKTQAALSEKIAQQENLSCPPKDTVNRAFKQEYVSPTTIARIAKILQVDPNCLYLDEQEEKTPLQHEVNSQKYINQAETKPILGQLSMALYSHSPEVDFLTNTLHEMIHATIRTIIINPALLEDKSMSVDIARKYQSDAVLVIRNTTYERHLGIQIYLYFNSVEQLIWTSSVSIIEMRQQHKYIAQHFIPFLYTALGMASSAENILPVYESINAQEEYLQARVLLNNHQSEINLKRAQSLLLSAIDACPEFARAHAALGESYIHESWRGNEKKILEQAQLACEKAQRLSPQDSYINSIVAFLYRRTGRSTEAIKLCQTVLQKFPENVDAFSGLANAFQVAYQHDPTQYPDALFSAVESAEKAVAMEPDNWKHQFDLGNARFTNGQIMEAISAFEAAAKLNPNEGAYINLGTMYNCLGQLAKAIEFFNKAHKMAPHSYLGNEYLASIYYYLEDFHKSAELKEKALNTFIKTETVGMHQMWGELADAYGHTGQIEKAIEAYTNAIKIIDRDALRGNATIMDDIYHDYYLLALHQINPEQFPLNKKAKSEKQLEHYLSSDLYPSAYLKLAQIQLINNNLEQSRLALEKAAATCPLYIHHPDLKPIKKLFFKNHKALN